MTATCPHCKKPIELVGAAELKDEFGLGPNSVQHLRDKGRFPEPWLSFGNRNIWLRETIENFVEERRTTKLEDTITELMKALKDLPEADREAALTKLKSES